MIILTNIFRRRKDQLLKDVNVATKMIRGENYYRCFSNSFSSHHNHRLRASSCTSWTDWRSFLPSSSLLVPSTSAENHRRIILDNNYSCRFFSSSSSNSNSNSNNNNNKNKKRRQRRNPNNENIVEENEKEFINRQQQQHENNLRLIKTDLQEHMEYFQQIPSSNKASLIDSKTNESIIFDSNYRETGIVKKDVTNEFFDVTDMYDSRVHGKSSIPTFTNEYELPTPLSEEIIKRIAVTNRPMSVSEYMSTALQHPQYGYYTNPTYTAPSSNTSSNNKDEKSAISTEDSKNEQGKKTGGGSTSVLDTIDNDYDDDWDNDSPLDDTDGNTNSANADDHSSTPSKAGNTNAADYVIGSKGDFITAPEISSLFGEMITLWFIDQYNRQLEFIRKKQKKINKSQQQKQRRGSGIVQEKPEIHIIELGPGKGSLLIDVLKTSLLKQFKQNFGYWITKIDLVETSHAMRNEQKRKLINDIHNAKLANIIFDDEENEKDNENDNNKSGSNNEHESAKPTSTFGIPTIKVKWHYDFTSVLADHTTMSTETKTTTIQVDSDTTKSTLSSKKSSFKMILAHEFFDALPIYVFEKTQKGWRERLVDINMYDEELAKEEEEGRNSTKKSKHHFEDSPAEKLVVDNDQGEDGNKSNKKKTRLRFVVSPDTTPALRTLLNVDEIEKETSSSSSSSSDNIGQIIEVCPEGIILAQDIKRLLASTTTSSLETTNQPSGGAALIMDYGSDKGSADTLRGFANHKQVHVLSSPGDIDITADVDFLALKHAVNNNSNINHDVQNSSNNIVTAYGPTKQGEFLLSMGIGTRIEKLFEDPSISDDHAEEIYNSLERLVSYDDNNMGERYKFLSIVAEDSYGGSSSPPSGFSL